MRAALQPAELAYARAAHLEHDIGVAGGLGRAGGDRRPGGLVLGVRNAGLRAGAGLHRHIGAERLVFLDGLGRRGDARLDRVGFGKNRDPHQAPLLRGGGVEPSAAVTAPR